MTDLLDRPRSASARRAAAAEVESVAPLWARGAFAALWTAAAGLAVLIVIALIDWAADSNSAVSAGGAMRFATAVWLSAGRTPLSVPGGTITLAPLGLTLLLALLLARAASMLARTSGISELSEVGVVVASVAAPYAVLSALLCLVARTGSLRPSPGGAFVTEALIAVIASGAGALRGADLIRAGWERAPIELRRAAAAAGASGLVLVGGGAIVMVGSLFSHSGAISQMISGYNGGTGDFAVVLLSILLLPNAILFGAAYLTGTGFAVGAGTSVGFTSVHAGPVPALPILAAVPHGKAPLVVTALCIVFILVAGVVAAISVERGSDRSLPERMTTIASTPGVIAVGALVLAAIAGGPAGPGTLRAFGPSPWQVGLSVGFEIGVVSAVAVLGRHWVGIARELLRTR
jgi:hypothetical protein